MKYLLLSLLILASLPARAQTALPTPSPPCSAADDQAAATAFDHAATWDSLHAAYTHYGKCENDELSEGFVDAVSKLLANHWSDLTQAVPIFAADAKFESWTVTHIDTSGNAEDIEKIDNLAKNACPATAKEFCGKLRAQIQSLSYE